CSERWRTMGPCLRSAPRRSAMPTRSSSRTGNRFKPEDRQFLIDRWRELRTATESAIREFEGARREFAELLRKLQTNEDFIDELLQIREHQRALDVIHTLTDGIRDASEKLKKLLGAIKPPGA